MFTKLLYLLGVIAARCQGEDVVETGKGDVQFRVVYPRDHKITWHPVVNNTLVCPPMTIIPIYDDNVEVPVITKIHIHESDHENEAKGHFCSKVKYSSICDQSMFWVKTYHKRIDTAPITLSECLTAVSDLTLDDPVAPHFPAYRCVFQAFGSTNTQEDKTFITVTPGSIPFDPFIMEFVHERLLSGKCQSTECRTIADHTVWVTQFKMNSACPEGRSYHGAWHRPKDHSSFGFLALTGLPPMSLSDACEKEHCKVSKIVAHGILMTHPHKALHLPSCTSDVKVGAITIQYEIDSLKVDFELSERKILCLREAVKIYETGKVTKMGLSLFSPLHPGPGTAYRLLNGVLEKGQAFYVGRQNLKGVEKYRYFERDSEGHMVGPNGMEIVKGVLIDPAHEMMEALYSERIMMSHDLAPIKHPVVISISDSMNISHHRVDLGGIFEFGGVHNPLGDLINFPAVWGPLVGLLVLTIAGCVLVKCVRKPQSHPEAEKGLIDSPNW